MSNNIQEGDFWLAKANITKSYMINSIFTFLLKIFLKLIEIALSVKVWIIATCFVLSTWLVINGYITGDNLAAIWVGTICPIALAREAFKLGKIFNFGKNMISKVQIPKSED